MEKETHEEEFEYNDGLGDMLREKESREFSWIKTSTIVIAIIIFVLGAFIISFNLGKKLISQKNTNIPIPPISQEEIQAKLEKIEQDNNELVNKIEQEMKEEASKGYLEPEETTQVKTTDLKEDTYTAEPITAEPSVKDAPKKAAVDSKTAPATIKTKKDMPQSIKPHPYKVIAGAFTKKENALNYTKQLKAKGIDSYIWTTRIKDTLYYRIQVGAFKDMKQADSFKQEVSKKGFDAYVLKK